MPFPFAHIVVGLPVEGPFDYALPQHLQEKVAVGQRVRVPFHGAQRVGFVVGLADKSAVQNLKLVLAVLEDQPSLAEAVLRLTKKMSEYCGCSWGEAIETSLPRALRKPKIVELSLSNVKNTAAASKPETVLFHDPSRRERWKYFQERIQETKVQEQGAIILVPEASMIDEGVAQFKKVMPATAVIFDKKIKPQEEWQQWKMVKEGKVAFVIGTRSAVFAPVANLGLIIVFEEDNSAYKQEQSPFYHVRDVARMRAEIEKCSLLFISTTPSAEIWHELSNGIIKKVSCVPEDLSSMQLVDLSNYNPAKTSVISFPLRNLMEKSLAGKERIVLLLNRKGFSTVTRCNQCGQALTCPRCNVNLTYLYSKKKMVCRMCHYTTAVPKICPQCKSPYLRALGTGIEKLESEAARIFPMARIARFDQESSAAPNNADILIATQAVFRILDGYRADVVAILDFDAQLNRVDFRSAQKAFASLIFLRYAAKKKLVVQTYQTNSYLIEAAKNSNFDLFYEQEIKLREELQLPPFKHLIAVGLRGREEQTVLEQAQALYERLQADGALYEASDPQPDHLAKLRDQYRFTIMLKTTAVAETFVQVKAILKDFKRKKSTIITVNLDP